MLDTLSDEEFIALAKTNTIGALAKQLGVTEYKIKKKRKELGLSKERVYNNKFPEQFTREIVNEEWRPAISHLGTKVKNTQVSNYGNVIGPQGRVLKWVDRGGGYPSVSIMVSELEGGYQYDKSSVSSVKKLSTTVHSLVANTFLPLEDNLPEVFREYVEINGIAYRQWDLFSDNLKSYIRSLFHVDHIDGNRANPHVSNLRYVSPRENNHHIKKALLENESSN